MEKGKRANNGRNGNFVNSEGNARDRDYDPERPIATNERVFSKPPEESLRVPPILRPKHLDDEVASFDVSRDEVDLLEDESLYEDDDPELEFSTVPENPTYLERHFLDAMRSTDLSTVTENINRKHKFRTRIEPVEPYEALMATTKPPHESSLEGEHFHSIGDNAQSILHEATPLTEAETRTMNISYNFPVSEGPRHVMQAGHSLTLAPPGPGMEGRYAFYIGYYGTSGSISTSYQAGMSFIHASTFFSPLNLNITLNYDSYHQEVRSKYLWEMGDKVVSLRANHNGFATTMSRKVTHNMLVGTSFRFDLKDYSSVLSFAGEYDMTPDDDNDTEFDDYESVNPITSYSVLGRPLVGTVSLRYSYAFNRKRRQNKNLVSTQFYTPVGPFELGTEFLWDMDRMISSYRMGLRGNFGEDNGIAIGMNEKGILQFCLKNPFAPGVGTNSTFVAKLNPWTQSIDYKCSFSFGASKRIANGADRKSVV